MEQEGFLLVDKGRHDKNLNYNKHTYKTICVKLSLKQDYNNNNNFSY